MILEDQTDAELEQEMRLVAKNARIFNEAGVSHLAKEAIDIVERIHRILIDRNYARKSQGPYR